MAALSLAEQILDTLDLATVIELTGLAWMHELRNAEGEWAHAPGDSPGKGVNRYVVPRHDRLISTAKNVAYADPADDPIFAGNRPDKANILKVYDAARATPGVVEQGRAWYPEMHKLAKYIGQGNAEEGAILLSTYSPQVSWPVNMINAARSGERRRALGVGEGQMITGAQQRKAQAAIDGAGITELMHASKTHSFARLLARGGDAPDDPYGHVVVDRHALSIAIGRQLEPDKNEADGKLYGKISKDSRYAEYVADAYREAAHEISVREGRLMTPYELQAITWLVQKAHNEASGSGGEALSKGRTTMTRNAWAKWMDHAKRHGIPLVPGVSASGVPTELAADDDPLWSQIIDLVFDPAELRDDKGRWTRMPGVGAERAERPQLGPGRGPAHRHYPEIGEEGNRGDSRAVSSAEFQHLAALGNAWIDRAKRHSSPITGMDQHWDSIKHRAFTEAQASWGGSTIDAHTGDFLPQGADAYAISVKPRGMHTVTVPEHASEAEFNAAMDQAKELFRPALERRSFYLGVFHDDEQNRIDIDPVCIVHSTAEVEQVGSYTRAIGGAYHFKSGNGYWPPHVRSQMQMADETIHFQGPGEWHTQAVAIQEPEPDEPEPGLAEQLGDGGAAQ